MIQACLNGARTRSDHDAVPLSPDELGADAAACGVESVHVHPRDAAGEQTLDAAAVRDAVVAIRAAAPAIEVTVSTGAFIEPDAARRAEAVRAWAGAVRPDAASVNFSEEGALEVCRALREAGMAVEAGLATVREAEVFAASGVGLWTVRVLVEVPERSGDAAVAHAAAIDAALDGAAIDLPRLWHGEEAATWAVVRAGLARGRDVRVGLEDVLVLPDGSRAAGNAALVDAARAL